MILAVMLGMMCAKEERIVTGGANGVIAGTVTDRTGAALAGVNVSVGPSGFSCVTDNKGKYYFFGVGKGSYSLRFVRSGYLDTVLAPVTENEANEVGIRRDVTMLKSTAVISGTVLVNGAPQPGIGVAISNQSAATISGINGSFSLTNVVADTSKLIAAGSVGWDTTTVKPGPGDTIKGVVINLLGKGSGYISGTVTDASGKPLSGITVSAFNSGITAVTDSTGSYSLTNIPPNTPVTVTTSNNGAVSGLTILDTGRLTGVNISPVGSQTSHGLSVNDVKSLSPAGIPVVVTVPLIITTSIHDSIEFYLWDKDSNGTYDSITSGPSLSFPPSTVSIKAAYAVITSSGDTLKGGITIQRVPIKPKAMIGGDTTIARNAQAFMNGRAICQTGGVVSYKWDFDGDGIYDWTRADGGVVRHRYTTSGIFKAHFLVTGIKGDIDTATMTVTVRSDTVTDGSSLIAPNFVEPANNSTDIQNIMCTFTNATGTMTTGVTYGVYVGRTAPPESLAIGGISMPQAFITNLTSGTWFLQAFAANGTDTARGLVIRILVKRVAMPPIMNLPKDSSTVRALALRLSWFLQFPDPSVHYNIYLGPDDPPGLYKTGVTDTFLVDSIALRSGDSGVYYWQVQASNGVDSSISPKRTVTFVKTIPATDTTAGADFTSGPNMNINRMAHEIALLDNNTVGVFGGHGTGFVSLSSAEIWTLSSNAFQTVQMNYYHDWGSFVKLANGTYLLAGGAADLGVAPGYSTAEIFDPAQQKFTPLTSMMSYGRMTNVGAQLTNGKVLIAGGWYDATSPVKADLFDPTAASFTATGALVLQRANPVVLATSDGKAVVAGGYPPYGGALFPGSELYDPSSNSFSLFSTQLFAADTGWLIVPGQYYGRDLATQKMPNGTYMLMATRGNSYALVVFDPAAKAFTQFAVQPGMPSSNVDSVSLFPPIVSYDGTKVYILALSNGTGGAKLRLYQVTIASHTITQPTGFFAMPAGYYPGSSAMLQIPDGRIFMTGGAADNTNFSPLKGTYFITPK